MGLIDKLSNIANAIRVKTGKTNRMTLDTMVTEIENLKSGTSSNEVTATKSQVLSGYTTITNDSNNEIVEGTMPNRGTVLASVNLNESYTIPSGYHNGSGKVYGPTATSKAATTYNTSTSDQTIEAGVYTTGVQTIKAVKTSGISAANVKKGVTVTVGDANSATRIANVAGTLENLSKITITDSSCANKAVTCVSESESLSGTMDGNGSYTFYVTKQETYTISCDGNTTEVDGSVSQNVEFGFNLNLTIYSAANDTVYYKDDNGENVILCTTDATGKAENVQFIRTSSENYINLFLYSTVAYDPGDTSKKYSKTIMLTKSTSEINVMPDGEVLYWYGYKTSSFSFVNFSGTYSHIVNPTNIYMSAKGEAGVLGRGDLKFTDVKITKNVCKFLVSSTYISNTISAIRLQVGSNYTTVSNGSYAAPKIYTVNCSVSESATVLIYLLGNSYGTACLTTWAIWFE